MTYNDLLSLLNSSEMTLTTSDGIPFNGRFCNGHISTPSGKVFAIIFRGRTPVENGKHIPECEFQLTGTIDGSLIDVKVSPSKITRKGSDPGSIYVEFLVTHP